MNTEFFPPKPEIAPTIYAYELPGVPSHKGYLKIGYTEQGADARVRQQLRTAGLAVILRFASDINEPTGKGGLKKGRQIATGGRQNRSEIERRRKLDFEELE